MSATRGPARAVVFDLDGVLVMSEHLWEESWIAFAAAHGRDWGSDDTRTCQGLSVGEWSAFLAARCGTSSSRAAEAVVDQVAEAYSAGRVQLLDGAAGLVAEAAGRVPVGLATSAPRRIIEVVMSSMGLAAHFSATVSSAEVARGKPHPDVYLEAARRLGVPAVDAVGVEDSTNGVRAAAAAGLRVICLEHRRYPVAADAGRLALAVVGSLVEVRARLAPLLPDAHRRKETST